MNQPPRPFPFREVLLTNGSMLTLLAVLYSIGRLSGNLGLLIAFLLGAGLFALLELGLCLRAVLTGQRYLAMVYGALFLVVANLDWWLWKQL